MRIATKAIWFAAALGVAASTASADGFRLHRYDPSPAGAWFFAVGQPYYSNTRYLAGGFTLDYGHNVLRSGVFDENGKFKASGAVVEHAVLGHFDIAGAPFSRLQINASLPVTFTEKGKGAFGVEPLSGASAGDPRIGAIVRLVGDPDEKAFSLNLGASLWIPIDASSKHQGDRNLRFLPKIILAGRAAKVLRWVFDVGFLLREKSRLGEGPGNASGTDFQINGALAYADVKRAFQLGPEIQFATILTGGHAFDKYFTSVSWLFGGQYSIKRMVQIGAAVGGGILPQYGEPDVRFLFRLAYAPLPGPDADKDGVPDAEDACPASSGARTSDRTTSGCPDADNDGVPDAQDACPGASGKRTASLRTSGCPDADDDGIPDAEDRCPDRKSGKLADPNNAGCPLGDVDDDGVADAEDQCPNEGTGKRPDPKHPGCPWKDADDDGVADADDACPNQPPGQKPDPARAGCPEPDRDGDGFPDAIDACPDRPGGEATETNQRGCPKIEIKQGVTTELKMVNFEVNRAVLLPESYPVLDEIAKILKDRKELRRIVVEGHADDTGTPEWNQKLSENRARAVMSYLVKRGVAASRLSFAGYGDTRPLEKDTSDAARAKNRRVEMRVLTGK